MEIKPPKIKRDTMKKVISLFDTHIPHQIDLSGIYRFLKDEKPDVLILGGDIMNVDSLSHWSLAGNKRLTLEGKRFKKECDEVIKVLDALRKAVGLGCELIYLEGNHEDWINQYIEQNPAMKGIIDLPLILGLKSRGIKWIPYRNKDNYFKVGKLYFTHGEYVNKYHSAKMLQTWNCNIRYGHLHSHQVSTKTSKRGIGDFHKAISVPCLCKDGDYLGGKSNNWEHGFHIAYVKPNGNFFEYIVPIIDGEFYFNGKMY